MRSIFLMMLFFAGAVGAAPVEKVDRMEYATSLNSMASTIMNWYGSLIRNNEAVSFIPTEQRWQPYRAQYPNNISQIHITSSNLIKLDSSDKYQFKVNALISHHNADGQYSELITETFIFQVALLAKPVIKNITRDQTKQVPLTKTDLTSEFNRNYYKAREFSYAWLAYLDGVMDMQSVIDAEQGLDSATYSMKIGGKEVQGSVASILAKRKQFLAKGGGLLRSLELKKIANKPDLFMLELIIEWKGVNFTGKPVLAKIHQQIEFSLQNNMWKVQSISEQHLLPDIAPWVGLLC